MEISGVVRRSVSGSIQDPGSTRMPLQVRDLEGAIQAVVSSRRFGDFNRWQSLLSCLKDAVRSASQMVRAPDDLFLVLIESRPQP
jgi:hypothetical protein